MCGNAGAIWYQNDGEENIRYFGPHTDPDAWLGKLVVHSDKIEWFFGFTADAVLTGTVATEDAGREIIETLHEAVDAAGGFTVTSLTAISQS